MLVPCTIHYTLLTTAPCALHTPNPCALCVLCTPDPCSDMYILCCVFHTFDQYTLLYCRTIAGCSVTMLMVFLLTLLTLAPALWRPWTFASRWHLQAVDFRVLNTARFHWLGWDDITPMHAREMRWFRHCRISTLSCACVTHCTGADRQVGNLNVEETKHVSSALQILPVCSFLFITQGSTLR